MNQLLNLLNAYPETVREDQTDRLCRALDTLAARFARHGYYFNRAEVAETRTGRLLLADWRNTLLEGLAAESMGVYTRR